MEKKKKNNSGILVGILIGLVIAIIVVGGLFAIGTIGFKTSKTSDNGQTSENNQTDTNINGNNNEETTNNSDNLSWTQYILTQHILEAKVSTVEKESIVTLDDLKEVLPKFENTKIIKTWYDSRGSMVDGVSLNISYENNDNKYIINIDANNNYCEIYGSSLNDELKNIIESAVTSEKNDEMKSTGKYFYELSGCDSKVLDKLIK